MSPSLGFLFLARNAADFHDHAVDAVAALRGLLVDEGFLHRMQFLRRAEAFQRHHLLLRVHGRQRRDAGADRGAVDMDSAGAALAKPAAEARAVKLKVVAQHIEQRHLRVVVADRDTRLPFTVSDFLAMDVSPRARQRGFCDADLRSALVGPCIGSSAAVLECLHMQV